MKKNFLALAGATFLALAMLSGCDTEGDTYHITAFYPTQSSGMIMYADQTVDSIWVQSADAWTAKVTASWLVITPTSSGEIPEGYIMQTKLTLTAAQNTTGTTRSSQINVDGYDKIGMPVYQFGWLNITSPSGTVTNTSADGIATGAKFEQSVSAKTTALTVAFRNYQDGATISGGADWVSLPDSTYAAGSHTLTLAAEENTSTEARTATFTLTSGSISTPFSFTQAGKTE